MVIVIIMRRTAMNIKKSKGLSLIELLVSMVLGLTLATGVIQIYAGSNTTEREIGRRASAYKRMGVLLRISCLRKFAWRDI